MPSRRPQTSASSVLFTLLVSLATSRAADEYEVLCDRMVEQYQLAARYHNANRFDDEQRATASGLEAFSRAVALDPSGPQAYLHQGTFLQNTHRFDEAIEQWRAVRPLVAGISSRAPGGGSWKAFIDGRETVARIGRAAVARDAAYQEGQGNISAALGYALELVDIAPRAPHFLFEAGTIAWVDARETAAVDVACGLLERSQAAAAAAAAAFVRRDRAQRDPRSAVGASGGRVCPDAATLLHARNLSVLGRAASTLADAAPAAGEGWDALLAGQRLRVASSHGSAYVASFEGAAGLYGGEGVVAAVRESAVSGAGLGARMAPTAEGHAVAAAACPLLIFGGASWPFQALHKAFWLSQETWRADAAVKLFDHTAKGGSGSRPATWMRQGPQPARSTYPRLASLVSYASTDFYHFVLEGLPRLALLLPVLLADPTLPLAVPTTRTKLAGGQGFVAQLLQLALPADFEPARLVPYADEGDAPGERLRASTQLIWADWPSADVTADGFLFGRADGRTDGRPTHCLTPAPVLRAAAAMVARAWEAKHPEAHEAESEARPALIVAVRRDVSMRNLAPADEASLLSELRNLAAEVHWELVVFDGSAGIAGGVPLFRRARAVVGVHGGALSNVLFSAHDSAENGRVLLVELTVASRIAAHYAHAAAALGLRYQAVPLVDDGHGVGASSVRLPEGAAHAVAEHVAEHARRFGGTGADRGGKEELR